MPPCAAQITADMGNFHCVVVEASRARVYGCVMDTDNQSTKPRVRASGRKAALWSKAILGIFVTFLIWSVFLRSPSIEVPLEDQAQLLALARQQLIASVAGEDLIPLVPDDITPRTQQLGAAFVSLTVDGGLRGCMIDRFEPHEPLFVNVLHNLQLAVDSDDRFTAITRDEVSDVRIKVSIVYKVKDVRFKDPDSLLTHLTSSRNGVILDVEGELAAYLPSVWDIFPDAKTFLEQLCIKANWEPDRWRTEPYPTVRTFQVYEFGDSG